MRKRCHIFLAVLVFVTLTGISALADSPYFVVKGDLHCHSDFSHDSDVPIDHVVRESKLAGYDFIAITDHNTTRHMEVDHSIEGLLVIPGYEYTTSLVHINIFGLREIPRKTAVYSKQDVDEYLNMLRRRGALFQLNHPNDPEYYSRFGYDLDVHFLEIYNGVWREDDYKTLRDWHELLVQGRRLVATGGTDAHRNHTKRGVYNNVFVTELSEEAILEALLAGRSFVTTSPDGPEIFMSVGDVLMGGTAIYEEGQQVHIEIRNIKPETIIRVYSNRGLEWENTLPADEVRTYSLEMNTAGKKFIRVELWSDAETIIAYTNPIYIEHQ